MKNNNTRFEFRLSKEEKNKIIERAEKAGFGKGELSKYVKQMCLKGRVVDYSELRELNRQLNKIGNNINQAVRIMNTYFDFTGEDFNVIKNEFAEVQELVNQYCKTKK